MLSTFLIVIIAIAAMLRFINEKSEHQSVEVTQKPTYKGLARDIIFTLEKHGSLSYANLVIESGCGNTKYHEIDGLIVSPYGIFCIEEKRHHGIISGDTRERQRFHYRDGEVKKLYNPLHQNYGHARSLEKLLARYLRAPIHEFAPFTNAKFIDVQSDRVFTGRRALDERIARHTTRIYSDADMIQINAILLRERVKSKARMDEHTAQVVAYTESLAAI